jgi:phage terminase Nu1 subunit (DNA packaging protein)
MSRASIERRLTALTAEVKAAQEEVRVISEQLEHFVNTAEDARLRSLVSETPLATREHRHAAKTVTNLRKDLAVWTDRLSDLERQQDQLLDELVESSP